MTKTISERIAEVRRLYEQLDALGLHDGVDAIAEFRKLANVFVRTGESSTGALPIPAAGRVLVYTFHSSRKNPCTIVLRALPHSS
jgi:hypothetical protein